MMRLLPILILLSACTLPDEVVEPSPSAFAQDGAKLIRSVAAEPYCLMLTNRFNPDHDTLYLGTGTFECRASDVLDGTSDLVMLACNLDTAFPMALTLGCQHNTGTYRLTIYQAKP